VLFNVHNARNDVLPCLIVIGRTRVRLPAGALPGNDSGQVVHTNCASVTKQYNLVPCVGFALVMWQPCMGPVNKGSIVERFCSDLDC